MWDFQFHPDAPSVGSHDGIQLYGSSVSSNSRSWMRENNLMSNLFLVADGIGQYMSSPSDISPAQQWTPPVVQEINTDDYVNSRREGVVQFSPTMEGTSASRDSGGSASSRSDGSTDTESLVAKSHSFHHRNRRCFLSKAIHPLSFSSESISSGIPHSGPAAFLEFGSITQQREGHHQGRSASDSVDLAETTEPVEYDSFDSARSPGDHHFRCGLCQRLLSQRSSCGDMPVSGVLFCRHVFHAECLDQTTPKARRSDPPCPICVKVEEETSPEQPVISKLTGFPLIKPLHEDGPSKPWNCGQAGDCVEGALHTPSRNVLLSLTRSRFGKSWHSNAGREFPGKMRKNGSSAVH